MPAKPKKNGRQNYDWDRIMNDYVCNPTMSLRKISEKYGIPSCTVYKQSKADNWFATKQEYRKNNRAKVRAKVSAKQVNELAGLVEASDYIEKTILKAFSDPEYFKKHIVTQNLNEEQATLDILNTKAMKDMMRVIKDVEDVKRSILDIRKADVTERMRIEQERLELEKERLALEKERIALKNSMSGSDGENNYGVVIMPEVIAMNSKQNIIWQPQPKQIAFMQRPEFECLYGGAAGGGKSDALVVEALRQVHIPYYKALILRKTYPQLTELIDKSQLIYPRAIPGARYNSTTHTWTFPSGAKIVFGSMPHNKSKTDYQGKAFDLICFDELTHFEYDEYTYLYSRCRPNGPGTRCYIRSTTNPGGKGHNWVKDRFITAAPPMTPIVEDVEVTDNKGKVMHIKRDRIFVPATVFDNQKLLDNDPSYIASLGMMPEAEKRALLYGDWDSFSGQVFNEWRNDPRHYDDRKWTHVVNPFQIPDTWPIYRGMDWGYAKPFSVGWYAVAPGGCLYRIRELYGCTGEPNTGVKWTPQRCAEEIWEIEHDDPNLAGRYIYGVADSAIFASDSGVPIVEAFEQAGIYFEKGDKQRIPGKMQCHYRLAFDEDGQSMFYVFKTCKHFIRCIPSLVYDETNVEDVDTSQEDHNYDEWRYVCMSRPIEPRINVQPEDTEWTPPPDDPLNLLGADDGVIDPFDTVMLYG